MYAWRVDHGHYLQRNQCVMERLKGYEPKCIDKNRDSHPFHPLRLSKDLELMEFYKFYSVEQIGLLEYLFN
ncbi:hypothetical protein ACFOGI_10635 [Virgibacillus xinjiangensis]|uniref:Uncharacterized protein n=1 Tax=Virgibacillus xinjiangensis TaxID=393090 RepID=A0ABV7CWH7_9BACI